MVLDLLVVAGTTDVVTVLELAGNANQKYLTVPDRTRILAVVYIEREKITSEYIIPAGGVRDDSGASGSVYGRSLNQT